MYKYGFILKLNLLNHVVLSVIKRRGPTNFQSSPFYRYSVHTTHVLFVVAVRLQQDVNGKETWEDIEGRSHRVRDENKI